MQDGSSSSSSSNEYLAPYRKARQAGSKHGQLRRTAKNYCMLAGHETARPNLQCGLLPPPNLQQLQLTYCTRRIERAASLQQYRVA